MALRVGLGGRSSPVRIGGATHDVRAAGHGRRELPKSSQGRCGLTDAASDLLLAYATEESNALLPTSHLVHRGNEGGGNGGVDPASVRHC